MLNNDWQEILQFDFAQNYYQDLMKFIDLEYKEVTVYPQKENIYKALEWTSFADTKVVILGQDPYHGPNQAIGLSFSVAPEVKIPPSLRNIYKELQNDLGYQPVKHGYLKSWSEQGVLLLNSTLTVRAGKPNSHRNHGWERLTDNMIKKLSEKGGIVFILWGNSAKDKISLIDQSKNRIVSGTHPSPFSAHKGFFGTHPFSKTNNYLKEFGKSPINWKLPDSVK